MEADIDFPFGSWLRFPGSQAIYVSGVDKEGIWREVAFTGGILCTPSSGERARSTPSICGHPLDPSGDLAEALAGLIPGDRVRCSHPDGDDFFLFDGRATFPAGRLETKIWLIDPTRPLLAGAFGAALFRALALQGVLTLHAAGLRLGELCVLALGKSGSGKSTLSVTALGHGGLVISDDMILVSQSNKHRCEKPCIHPLRRDLLLCPKSLCGTAPKVAESLNPGGIPGSPKLRLTRQDSPDFFADQGVLSCIVTLSRKPRPPESRLFPISQAQALSALIATNPYLSNADTLAMSPLMQAAVRLVSSTPAFELLVGSRLLDNPVRELECIEDLLRRHIPQREKTALLG